MNIVIRRAVKEDCVRLMELVNELALYEKAPDEVTVTLPHFIESGFGENPVWWAFVAEVDGRVEGFALYYIRYSTWKGQYVWLEDFVVDTQHRGKGIGHAIFEAIADIAKAHNTFLKWQVLDWNEPAMRFYDKYPVQYEKEWITCRWWLG